MKKIYIILLCFLIIILLFFFFNLNANKRSKTVVQPKQLNSNIQKNSDDGLSNSEKSINEKITIAKVGSYISDKGILISIPLEWDKKVEITENISSIILTYAGIPNRKFTIFTINCFSHSKFDQLKSSPDYFDSPENIIGQNQKYVFCIDTPFAIDLTTEEQNIFSKEIQDFLLPLVKYKEKLTVIPLD
jgi:hypothetical protein